MTVTRVDSVDAGVPRPGAVAAGAARGPPGHDDPRGESRAARQRLGVPARRGHAARARARSRRSCATGSVTSRGSPGRARFAPRRRRSSPTRSSATSSRRPGSASRRSSTRRSAPGLMARDATVFPQAIGLASTWDPALAAALAEAIGGQMRAVGAHQGLAPVLDVCRDPRWGRTEETFGEDPYLVARMGVAFVRGLQGESLARRRDRDGEALRRLRRLGRRDELGAGRHPAAGAARGVPPSVRGGRPGRPAPAR